MKGTFVDGELIQGTEYDNFGKIKYKGEFKQKDYHGKGEIYENGDLVYKGTFVNGIKDG